MEQNIGERVAVLETEIEVLKQFREEEKQAHEKIDKAHEKIIARLDDLSAQVTKHISFIGGITFVLSGIWALFMFAKDWLLTHLKG